MKKTRNSNTTIALILTLITATTLIAFPIATAHDPPWQIPTWCYVAASPNPVGVTQDAVIVFWVNPYIPTRQGKYGDSFTYEIDVTKPDGSEETFGPITSDPVGGGFISYTPDQVGTYTIVARFLGHTITGLPLYPGRTIETISGADYVNDTFLESESEPTTLTVTQEPIDGWPESTIPEEYWTRPIYGANREWWPIAGNWLGGAAQNNGPTNDFAYGLGPESGHIMWATPYWDGGLMDARFSDHAYYQGLSYESYWSPPLIINGRLYYNVLTPPRYGWYAVDMNTGEQLFFQNTTGPMSSCFIDVREYLMIGEGELEVTYPPALRSDGSGSYRVGELSFGQILNYQSPNQHGGLPYLWSQYGPERNTWMMFDAYTGNYILSLANVSSGTAVYGKDGSLLRYRIVGSGANKRLTVWNSTHAIQENTVFIRNWYWCWRPFLNKTLDGNYGFSLNVSIPNVQGSIYEVREDEYIIGGTAGKKNATHTIEGNMWALSLEKGKEGTLLWEITFVPPETRPDEFFPVGTRAGIQGPYVYPEDGVFVFADKEELVWYGYSLDTGQQIWGPTEKEVSFNYYSTSNYAYEGMLLTFGYGGELRAYDMQNGNVLWKYKAIPVGFEYYGFENCPLSLDVIADGKIYLHTTEHSPNTPLRRSSYIRCIDAETGNELWKILHWGQGAVMADGYLVDLNLYDNQIYCYGKGPSETTVMASPKVTALGSNVLIEGTIMDIASGTNQLEIASRFPNGVAAISDEDQEAWMEYVYMHQVVPTDAEGVEVVITTYDPNGNTYELGRATTDMSGTFGCAVDLPVPGVYKIIATFEGSKSYYGSCAVTYITVEQSPSPGQQLEPELAGPAQAAEAPFIATDVIVILAAVIFAVIALAGFFILRKQR